MSMNWKLPNIFPTSVDYFKPGAKASTASESELSSSVIEDDEDDLGIMEVQHKGTVPFRRVESAVHNFVDVALPVNLDRLNQHKCNIKKWQKGKDIGKLQVEYANAGSTVKQLTRNVMEMEALRARVIEDDLHIFDKHLMPAKAKSMEAVQDFLKLKAHDSTIDNPSSSDNNFNESSPIPLESAASNLQNGHFNPKVTDENHSMFDQNNDGRFVQMRGNQLVIESGTENLCNFSNKQSFVPETDDLSVISSGQNIQLVAENRNSEIDESWEKLRKDIEELHEIMKDFSAIVNEQGQTVDNISDNIETASENINEGKSQLKKASILKAAMFPVLGAVVGGAVGGPIGMAAGLKLGSVATGFATVGVTGSVIGYHGGKALKKRQEDANSFEMSEIKKEADSSSEDSFEFLENNLS